MNPAGGEENDGDRNGHDAKSDRRLQPSAKRAHEQHDCNEHETQLEQNEREESGAPARRAALANAANRLEKAKSRRHFRPNANGVKENRRSEGDERKHCPRSSIVDSLVFEKPERRSREKNREQCHRRGCSGKSSNQV